LETDPGLLWLTREADVSLLKIKFSIRSSLHSQQALALAALCFF
jgi:hypothetical protein